MDEVYDGNEPMSGGGELLAATEERRCTTSNVTSDRDMAESPGWTGARFAACLDTTIAVDSVPHTRPAAELFLLALHRTECSPNEAVAIGAFLAGPARTRDAAICTRAVVDGSQNIGRLLHAKRISDLRAAIAFVNGPGSA